MARIRWGIIGCGDVTEVKSGPALQKAEGSELMAVMRRSADRAADYARRHGVPKWYDDAGALIADADVDAVYIATPPDSHAAYTLMAADAGKPVYVEKPMARTHSECVEMVAACERAQLPLFVAYYRRRLPAFLQVRSLLRDGAIGEVRMVIVRITGPPSGPDHRSEDLPWRVRPEVAGDGYFFDLGSHQLDLLDYLLGPIADAAGSAANQAGLYAANDAVCATFRFESGVMGTGSWCFTAFDSGRTDRTEIIGSAGGISYSAFDLAAPVVLERDGGNVEKFTFPPPDHVQQPLIQTVVDDLLGRGSCPSTGQSAARTSRVLDQIVAA